MIQTGQEQQQYGSLESANNGESSILIADTEKDRPRSFTIPRWLKLFLAISVGVLAVTTTFALSVRYSKSKHDGVKLDVMMSIKENGRPSAEKILSMTYEERAKDVLSRVPLIDGHNDLAWVMRQRMQNHVYNVDLMRDVNSQWGNSHTDIPRLRTGMIGAQFWSCYVSCSSQNTDAVRISLDQLDTIKRFVEAYPDTFTYVTTAKGISEAFSSGKIASLIGLEGGHSIDSSLATLRMFYDLGVRYMTLTHSCNTPWGDSSTQDDQPDRPGANGGLSEFGKTVVKEMNRMGMMVDLSHVSHDVMSDAIDASSAPVFFSHSSAWSICHNNRNVRDDILKRVATNGGMVMVNFYNEFINCEPNYQEVSTISQVADHIDHIYKIAGPDHIGIGGDYDGVGFGSMPNGLRDVSHYPELFTELARRGWSTENLEKVASKNLIRVFTAVEQERDRLTATEKPLDDHIPQAQVQSIGCRPDF